MIVHRFHLELEKKWVLKVCWKIVLELGFVFGHRKIWRCIFIFFGGENWNSVSGNEMSPKNCSRPVFGTWMKIDFLKLTKFQEQTMFEFFLLRKSTPKYMDIRELYIHVSFDVPPPGMEGPNYNNAYSSSKSCCCSIEIYLLITLK